MRIVEDVFNTLGSLNFQQQGLFGSLVVEKMMPNFAFFYAQNAEEVNNINSILNICFDHVLTPSGIDRQDLSDFQEKVEELTPDLDSETGAASYAFDFCVSLDALLNFFQEFNFQEIETILEQSIATVDMYIQEYLEIDPSDPELESKIVENSFMTDEVERQRTLLKIIQSIDVINEEQVLNLREVNKRFPNMINLNEIY